MALFPTIRVPTLVLHPTGDLLEPIGHARAAAARMPGARLNEQPGAKHDLFEGAEDVADEVEELLNDPGRKRVPPTKRIPAAAKASR